MIKENAKFVSSKLKKQKEGVTITELSEICKLSRTTVRTVLALLEGKGDVVIRKVGMAKIYKMKPTKN